MYSTYRVAGSGPRTTRIKRAPGATGNTLVFFSLPAAGAEGNDDVNRRWHLRLRLNQIRLLKEFQLGRRFQMCSRSVALALTQGPSLWNCVSAALDPDSDWTWSRADSCRESQSQGDTSGGSSGPPATPHSPPVSAGTPPLPLPYLLSLYLLEVSILCPPNSSASFALLPLLTPRFLPCLPGRLAARAAILWDLLLAVITSGSRALGLPYR